VTCVTPFGDASRNEDVGGLWTGFSPTANGIRAEDRTQANGFVVLVRIGPEKRNSRRHLADELLSLSEKSTTIRGGKRIPSRNSLAIAFKRAKL
jgi:hypothetical protein